ncbi:MAG: biotin/lipoyl-containing protein, partial [Acidimicrobiales bacterium]
MSEPAAIQRLGVLDRGEAAVRVLRAVAGLNSAGDAPLITTVLLHGDSNEPNPWDGREADEVRTIDVHGSVPNLVRSLQQAQVDTVWLGPWGNADRADLVEACEDAEIVVVGPDSETIRRLGDPDALAQLTGSETSLDENSGLRRIEVDVLADDHGTVWILDTRLSLRRNGVPLIAEAPCHLVDAKLCQQIRSAASNLIDSVHYQGAATLAYLSDGTNFSLAEVDCVAAPVHATTEERTGSSVIGWRLRIERGEALPAHAPPDDGVAVEARLLAEDPEAGFEITPGRLMLLSFPVGTGVRIDANRRVGDMVEANDPLIAVFTAWGPDRSVALERVRRALARSAVVLNGGTTNRTFLLQVLGHDDLISGAATDSWLTHLIDDGPQLQPHPVPLLAAAAAAYEEDRSHAQEAFYASAERGRPQQPAPVGDGIELSYGGRNYRLDVDRVGPYRYSIRHGRNVADIKVDELDQFERRITCGGRRHRLVIVPNETGFRIELGSATHTVERQDGVALRAGWPALVVSALVQPGDTVSTGDPIAVLESMKMETTVTAPFAGEVVSVLVIPNSQVERGAPLVRLRSHEAGVAGSEPDDGQVDLSGLRLRVDPTRKPCDQV